MSIKHKVAINATENIKAKLTFYRETQSKGVMIKGYQTDNGVFNTSEFMEDMFKKQQKIRFSGCGASYQNVAAERDIKTVVAMERTMLIHASLIFPEDTLSTDIWTMAMDCDVWVYNWIPDMHSELSAIGIWSRSRFEPVPENRSNFHV